jgi:hypothetical protein
MKRKLIKVDDYKEVMAQGYEVEGTPLYILELLIFGFAYSSYFLLVRSRKFLSQLNDEKIKNKLIRQPTQFGKRLDLGKELEMDKETNTIYYIDP